jgi:3-hydroxyacyl-CoA dehydrogenase/enoyl-CoA hydratase/3-hydroxybutyryl-CoA epimerase
MTTAPAGARYEPGDDGVGRIVIDRPNDSANAIDPPLLAALLAAIDEARQAGPRGLVFVSAKPDQFVAGADLALFNARLSAADIGEASRAMHRIIKAILALPFTTVAAINGSALGGGFELALACDYRVAADSPGVRIGLPEVQLGLLPAGAGTQLLPRLVGLPSALDLILGARRLSARRALRRGLVDEVVHPASLERAARDVALQGRKRGLAGGRSPLERASTWLAPARWIALRMARERVRKETRGHFPAPMKAIDAIAIGLDRGIDAGLDVEAAAFGELATGTVARNLIGLFVLGLRQRRAAFTDLPPASAPKQLGVVGAGLMGAGIAQAAAIAGMSVRVRDVDDAAVTRGLDSISSLTEAAGRKGAIDRREARRAIARVSATTDWTGFARSDLVVEAVFEELALKKRVLAELEAVAGDDTVIASNTSALPIASIAADARHPERIVGMHFFSPVHRMTLVEVVWPKAADPSAVARVAAAGQALGKTVIVVRDGPGFYTTRTLGVMLGEAARLLEEGLSIEEIDSAMTRFGWPIGPLALIDEVGIAVARHAGETVASAVGATAQRSAVRLLADAGLVGKRGGEGFYRYDRGRRTPNPRVYELLGTSGIRPASEQLGPMLTALFVNEAARCLDEGILRSAAEGDLGAVLGLGFPPFLGGPFRYADDYADVSGSSLADRLRAYANVAGPRYAPADSIASGRHFHP